MKVPPYYFDSALSLLLVVILGAHYLGVVSGPIDTVLLMFAAIIGTLPVFGNAYRAVREQEWASMDMLASIALAFSLIALQWSSAAFIALMLGLARILQEVTSTRTERSIRGLLKLRPNTVKVEKNGKIQTMPLERVVVGDIVVADLGERIAIDGVVTSGSASVDESSLTGESLPVEKKQGSKVLSSTLIASGSLHIQTQKVGKDTTLEKIITLVESARAEKPKTQTLGEKFGKAYLVAVFIGSLVLFAATRNVSLVLSVVLVVCADDIAIAIPLAYLGAIGSAARRGVIIKGAAHLETLGQAGIFVFDKTGTLTKGAMAVSRLIPEKGVTEKELLYAGSLAALRSQHPLARAIVAYAALHGVEETSADSFEQVSGRGIIAHKAGEKIIMGKAEFLREQKISIAPELQSQANAHSDMGQSVSFVATGKRVIGFFAIADALKPNAKRAIADLKKLGVKKTIMLTGDNERVAQTISKELGLDAFYANLLPEDKVALLKKFHIEGVVVMVGDGVNDAAALSVANVGVAMGGSGIDAAIESAEIVLMRDDLSEIAELMHLARTVQRISVEDFWIWGITNAAGLALVFGGLIGPTGAAAYNFISDFFPLLNSARVRIIHHVQRRRRQKSVVT